MQSGTILPRTTKRQVIISLPLGCIENPELDFDTLKSTYEDPQHPKERTYYHIIISYNTKSETIAPQDIKEMTRGIMPELKN